MIYIGTSGYEIYKKFHSKLFPKGNYDFLSRYQQYFNSLEINYTFYRLPKKKSVNNWQRYDLMYSFKISRYYRSLVINNPAKASKAFEKLYASLGDLADDSVFLLQFSENTVASTQLIKNITESIPDYVRFVIEGRNSSWSEDDILDLLVELNIPLVILPKNFIFKMDVEHVLDKMSKLDIIYIRFHGTGKNYNYSDQYLEKWKGVVEKLSKGRDIFVYFNNDQEGYAPFNALKIL